MICENCKQRPATVTVTHTRNGEHYAKHYCDVCSEEIGYAKTASEDTQPMSIAQIFSSWFGIPDWSTDTPESTIENQSDIQCANCHMTYQQFLQQGKFNCPHCYETFSQQLPQVFKRMHNGATKHIGKVPSGLQESYQLKKEIENLRQMMKIAIQDENFEEAASLRDKIYHLQAKLQQGGAEDDEL
ncbi:UvrB/UvrC motif-containing protein [Kurthia sibirica]|uniref:Nucleotide excision repair protein n=1 Tax=Kurthia sibirica TaxID=202750 RepID=A0A2U3AMB0_9BACL|nr:UvrB/UvrC motif-containing protein [Kurthia sibirica]PWI25654.1 nucleotide excision repair protein [Kurthia sibirica]GEK35477.1 hypothetical protein KSI01_30100 [Kurthia sibirica]